MSDEEDHDVTMDYGDGADNPEAADEDHAASSGQPEDLDEKYPNRPHNHSTTLPFHELITHLFNPLRDNRNKPKNAIAARSRSGAHINSKSPQEIRAGIILRFIRRWREHVGADIFPAFRLILPDKDRDRAMYGLKEKTIGSLLVSIMKIDKQSDDAFNLLNWRLPGIKSTGAGDFPQRCYDVIQKRPMRTEYGKMTVAEVNEKLDELSAAQKDVDRRPIFEEFYSQMNAEELLWLIRMILRQVKIGASEKTFLELWHPDADHLFNISSSLRRVCWELHDKQISLKEDESKIALMQCFQPQFAQFQMKSLEKMIQSMRLVDEEDSFWIEEKLDGERMQLHMIEDDTIRGGKRFQFWSRKAKDYTYLYGDGLEAPMEKSSLTRHLKGAFHSDVRNIILDGEMITWDPETGKMVEFGSLKTAALMDQKVSTNNAWRPVFRVFDCLFLNDKPLTDYILQDRYAALTQSVPGVKDRLEVHTHELGRKAEEVESELRQVVANSTEGLVLKNPKSIYRLASRNDSWVKVKPEYMTEFGDNLDCVVVGGYYGSGKRGGFLSSYLCGLRLEGSDKFRPGDDPTKCWSFFKVGGGFTVKDYQEIAALTKDKWIDWDKSKPPYHIVELGGGLRQNECPDVWIKPENSFVLEVKAASMHNTDQFRFGRTLRFPRFRRLRRDKGWKDGLSILEFEELEARVKEERKHKQFEVEGKKKAPGRKKLKKEVVVAGQDGDVAEFAGTGSALFDGKTFYIMSEQTKPKKSKAELEQLVKAHGGQIVQNAKDKNTICISDKNVVSAAALKKKGDRTVLRPRWLLDCITQSEVDVGREPLLLPIEPDDILFSTPDDAAIAAGNVDEYGDSYYRDTSTEKLRKLFATMPKIEHDQAIINEMRQLLLTV